MVEEQIETKIYELIENNIELGNKLKKSIKNNERIFIIFSLTQITYILLMLRFAGIF